MTKKNRGLKFAITSTNLAYLLIVLSPIFEIYAVITPSISFADIAIVVATFILTVKREMRYKLSKPYIILVIYMFIISILNLRGWSGFIHIVYYCLFIIMLSLLDSGIEYTDTIIVIYRNFALLEAVFIVLQKVLSVVIGVHIHGMIPNMLTTYNVSTNDYIAKITSARCSGNFTEPAMAARYLTIPLFLEIFNIIKKGKIVSARLVLLILAMACTYSGNAIIGLGLGFICYFVCLMKQTSKFKIAKIIIASLFVAMLVWLLTRFIGFGYLWNRRFELSGNSRTGNSTYIRVTRGFQVYNQFNVMQKIFGVGIGNYKYLVETRFYGIASAITDQLLDYMNGIQYYLCQGGAIGLSIFFTLYTSIKKFELKYHLWLWLTLLMFLITSSIATSSLFILFHLIIVKELSNEQIYT